MFTIRPYREEDITACGECFYEVILPAPLGLGTALFTQFLNKAEPDGTHSVRLFTNTLAS